MQTDFLVIGSGAAGLSFALKAAEHGRVTVVTKGLDECNTNYAQGGICSVTYAPDTFEKHIRDTLVCGAGKMRSGRRGAGGAPCSRADPRPDRMGHALRQDARRAVRAEPRGGGHSEHRILHYEDLTGAEIERALVASVRRHPNITLLERHYAVDLLTQHHLGEFVTRHTRGRHLLRRLCARPDDECDRNRAGEVHRSGCRRLRQRLFDHDQSRGGYRRRHRHVPPGEGHHGEHGVHPVPPPRRSTIRANARRSSSRRRCAASAPSCACKRRGVHGQVSSDEVARRATGGAFDLPRDAAARPGVRLSGRDAQTRRRDPQPLPPISTRSVSRSVSTSRRTGFPSRPRRTTAAAG